MSHTNEVMAIFEICAYFGQNLVAVPYTLAIRNVFFELADHEKPRCK